MDADCGFNKADEQESYEARKIIEEGLADKVHSEPQLQPQLVLPSLSVHYLLLHPLLQPSRLSPRVVSLPSLLCTR